MVKLTVFIGHPEDVEEFDEVFFQQNFFPKLVQTPEIEKVEVTRLSHSPLRLIENVDPTPPYYLQLELYFKDFTTYQNCWLSDQGTELLNDFLSFQVPFDFVVGRPILYTRGDIIENYNQRMIHKEEPVNPPL